ncbi:MAG: hypothetical protein LBQ13_04750 [Endomicrobium sp.]|jgi:hypothetical protein|nr:hypothetical protein [Endomicrobium sp.]
MKNTKSLKGYDDLIDGKKTVKFMILFVVGFSIIIVLSSLYFSYRLHSKAIDTVKVIDSEGRVIPSEAKRNQDVFIASLQAHIANSLYYLNTFDRNSIKENQARALFLVDKKSADRIFNSYNTTGAYNDAIRNSYIYASKFVKITSVSSKEPFSVEFEGLLEITDGDRIVKNKVIGKGKVRYNTPSFPYNTQGMLLYDYLQTYEEVQK